MVITTFVALAAPGFSKSCFDEGGSAADSNITFGGSVVSLLCYEFQTCRKWFKKIGWFVQVAKLGDWEYEVLLVISVLIQYRIIITVAILIAVDKINVSLNKVYFLENIANAINYFAIYSISNWNVNSKYNILNNKIK